MGISIDVSLKNIWRSWFAYRKGKQWSPDLHHFQYHLENHLWQLHQDLSADEYQHGGYRKFFVSDTKKREIAVASIRDRVVHRLVYDHLTEVYDKTFLYDAWSCRKEKGLLGAIDRAQAFFNTCHGFVWKADIQKFFDHVDHDVLLRLLGRRITDQQGINLLGKIVLSYTSPKGNGIGIPIGNLTSQIFANIYLNELDRFLKHEIKPKAYLRYGDDFLIFESSREKLLEMKARVEIFLNNILFLKLHPQSIVRKIKTGMPFLGIVLFPGGRKLSKRNEQRIPKRLNHINASSYFGLVSKHGHRKLREKFHWWVLKIG